MVKNEEDVIETFCRYTLGFCDRMLILEDNSDDRTREILDSLVAEGLAIVLIEKEFTTGFYKHENITMLTETALSQYGADLILPLDADEFVTTNMGKPVRNVLESLKKDTIYLFSWRTYVLTEEALMAEGNLFERFTFSRPPEFEHFYKTMISRELFMNDGYSIQLGQHDLDASERSPVREREISEELVFAHFPIRSVSQASNKIIIGWLNYLSIPGNRAKSGHWPMMYEGIKKSGGMTLKQAEKYSFYYSILSEDIDVFADGFSEKLARTPLNPECAIGKSKLVLKYTPEPDCEEIRMDILLTHLEKMAAGFATEKQKDLQEFASLKASNSWRTGRVVTFPVRMIKKLFRKS